MTQGVYFEARVTLVVKCETSWASQLKPGTERSHTLPRLWSFAVELSTTPQSPETETKKKYKYQQGREPPQSLAESEIIELGMKQFIRDFPGGPVVKTPCSQCRRLRFDPWSGNWIHRPQLRSN